MKMLLEPLIISIAIVLFLFFVSSACCFIMIIYKGTKTMNPLDKKK